MVQTCFLHLSEGKPFGNIMMKSDSSEMLRLGFHPRDSVNVYFSKSTVPEDIPYLRFLHESPQTHIHIAAELSASAENYLRQCGLSETETAKLKELLTAKNHQE